MLIDDARKRYQPIIALSLIPTSGSVKLTAKVRCFGHLEIFELWRLIEGSAPIHRKKLPCTRGRGKSRQHEYAALRFAAAIVYDGLRFQNHEKNGAFSGRKEPVGRASPPLCRVIGGLRCANPSYEL